MNYTTVIWYRVIWRPSELCRRDNSSAASDRPPAVSLLSQPRPPGFQRVDVVKVDFDGGGDGDGQHQAHASPKPSPEQKGHGHRERVELEAVAEKLRIEHVEREEMQGDHRDQHSQQVLRRHLSEADGERGD